MLFFDKMSTYLPNEAGRGGYYNNELGEKHIQYSRVSYSGGCFNIAVPYSTFTILAFYVGRWDYLMFLWFTLRWLLEDPNEKEGAGELFGAAVMSIQRAGMVASLILMLFLLTSGYYVQVYVHKFRS